MKYRALGKTGLKVSEIGFGAWAIGGSMWGGSDNEVSLQALRRALDLGVNFVDTAAVYGMGLSEQLVGEVHRERKGNFHIATKVPPKNFRWPPPPGTKVTEAFPKAWVREQTEKSLRNLRLDCVDLQQIHVWSPDWVSQADWWEELDKLRGEGKIRFIGVSVNDHRPDEALELARSGMADTIQVIYNIFDSLAQDELFPLCQERKVGVIARVPLDEGGLTGKFSEHTTFPDGDFRQRYWDPPALKELAPRVEKLKRLLVRGGIPDLPTAALKFCLSNPAVSTVIPGIRNPGQADRNCAASAGDPLRTEELEELKKHRWIHD